MDDIHRKTGLPRLSDEPLDQELEALDTDSSETLDVVEYRAFDKRALERMIQSLLAKEACIS